MLIFRTTLLALALGLAALVFGQGTNAAAQAPARQTAKLLVRLPDFCVTPDGMEIAPDGDLVVACPNFADPSQKACLIKVGKDHKVRKWVEVPPLAETGIACPMGLAFGPDGDLYVCDNQGWKGSGPGLSKGRMLRLRIKDDKLESCTVVAEGMEHPNGARIHGDFLYVTESLTPKVKDPSGLLVSAVYRFRLDDKNVKVTNTLEDQNVIASFRTEEQVLPVRLGRHRLRQQGQPVRRQFRRRHDLQDHLRRRRQRGEQHGLRPDRSR